MIPDAAMGDATAPVPIRMQNPIYPFESRRKKVEGVVLVELVVGKNGKVVEAHAISSPDPLLSQAAVTALLQAEFRPAMRAGVPVAVRIQVPITFDLKANPPAK
ncbi:MAG TPA: TonB family protein [Opitutaceae bacterium]|nr:TonB family protein [Opitutaceae bacterium]